MAEIAPAALKWMGSRVSPDLGGVLSGIIGDSAHKSGYHRGRSYVGSNDYSVRLAEDKKGLGTWACAIDMSFSTAKMKLYTGRLKAAADRNDPRLKYVREFYGTLNGTTVYGRTHSGSSDGTWESATSDKSHLWHIHVSILRQYADNKAVLQGILDVLMGKGLTLTLGNRVLQKGDAGSDVGELQARLNQTGAKLSVDNDFGSGTETAVKSFQSARKLTADGIVGSATVTALKAATNTTPTTSPMIEELGMTRDEVFDAVWRNDRLGNPYGDSATNPSIWAETWARNVARATETAQSEIKSVKAELVARDEADKVRDAATAAAVKSLAETISKLAAGGGSVDSAAIINAIREAADATQNRVVDLQNALTQSNDEIAELRQKLADAAQAEANALKN